jgi:acyl dehydratase
MALVTVDGVEEVRQLKGEIGKTGWREITQERVTAFADATDDHQWIHIDDARATAGPFGSTIAHGFLLLSLIPSFVEEILDAQGFSMAVNYGLDRVRFTSPVPTGSKIRGVLVVNEVRDIKGGVQVVWDVTIEMSGSQKPAAIVTMLGNFYA